jgi:serine/threonine protein kinase
MPAPLRERNPKIPVELERIIDRLLDKDRETRYQSAADLRADLKRVRRNSSETITVPLPARGKPGFESEAKPNARTIRHGIGAPGPPPTCMHS